VTEVWFDSNRNGRNQGLKWKTNDRELTIEETESCRDCLNGFRYDVVSKREWRMECIERSATLNQNQTQHHRKRAKLETSLFHSAPAFYIFRLSTLLFYFFFFFFFFFAFLCIIHFFTI